MEKIPITLVIIPGWGGTKETWSDFVSLANTTFSSVQVLELPCFGSNPCPKTVWGVSEYAAYVRLKLERLQTKNIVLLGHSFGGVVATSLVESHPSMIQKLVISGSPIFRQKHGLHWYFFLFLAKIGKVVFSIPGLKKLEKRAKKILYKAADSPDYNETDGIKRQIFQKITNESLGHLLPNIIVDTLVLWGDHDTYVPVKDGQKIAMNIPHATFSVILGGKHGLHRTNKEALLKELIQFVSP